MQADSTSRSGTGRPTDLIIFGGTGDLAMRMLFPSLYFLEADGYLADDARIIGAARGDLSAMPFWMRCISA